MKLVKAIIGCALAVSAPAYQQPSADTVKIVSITPETSAPLRVGQTVSFQVEVEYNLTSADSASLVLVIQKGESGQSPLANEAEVVRKGKARAVLSKSFVVPDTKAILLFTPLTAQGNTKTEIVDSRSYKVEKN
ncbi:MAG TPA: hypothetical protein VEQ63_03560 [Bryobacteraceae bacterium]|nr:hypothetical protein [Bryobacteraceae bacterium]